jgi:hypothetical protein
VAFGHSYTASQASTPAISHVSNGGGFGCGHRCFNSCHGCFSGCFSGCRNFHPRSTSFVSTSNFNLSLNIHQSNTTAFNSSFGGCGGCGFGGGSNTSFFNSNNFNLSLNVTAFNSSRGW